MDQGKASAARKPAGAEKVRACNSDDRSRKKVKRNKKMGMGFRAVNLVHEGDKSDREKLTARRREQRLWGEGPLIQVGFWGEELRPRGGSGYRLRIKKIRSWLSGRGRGTPKRKKGETQDLLTRREGRSRSVEGASELKAKKKRKNRKKPLSTRTKTLEVASRNVAHQNWSLLHPHKC